MVFILVILGICYRAYKYKLQGSSKIKKYPSHNNLF